MHKSAIFVEIRGALGMSQNPLFSPTDQNSKHTRAKRAKEDIFDIFAEKEKEKEKDLD